MDRKEAFDGAMRTLAEVRTLTAEKEKLLGQLERSLALKSLWWEVFDEGSCTTTIHAKPRPRAKDLTLIVKNGAGEERRFPVSEIPFILWPDPQQIMSAPYSTEYKAKRKELKQVAPA